MAFVYNIFLPFLPMFIRLLLLLFSLGFLPLLCFSQSYQDERREDKNRLQEILEKEIDKSRGAQNDRPGFSTLFPDHLPEWINGISSSGNGKIYVLGISDPGLDYNDAIHLAKFRLIGVASLIYKASLGNMRDFYTKEEDSKYANAFIDYTRFYASGNIDTSMVEVLNEHVTRFDEVVLLGVLDVSSFHDHNNHGGSFEITTDMISHARRYGNSTELVSRSNLNIKLDDAARGIYFNTDYQHHAINKIINTETRINGVNISSLPAMSLKYVIDGESENIDDGQTVQANPVNRSFGFSLRHGLWYAYYTAILFQLSDKAYGDAVNVYNLNELFNRFTQNLTREVVKNQVDCLDAKITIHDNQLFLECE